MVIGLAWYGYGKAEIVMICKGIDWAMGNGQG